MNTKSAVQKVLDDENLSQYRLAQTLGASSASVGQWLSNTKMSTNYAEKFERLYGITIDDAVNTYRKT